MKAMKKLTMQDIADKLGISKSAVSLALSDKYGVSDELRSLVTISAIEMGYVFQKVKKAKRLKNDCVALILGSDINTKSLFWIDIIKGVESAVNAHKYALQIIVSNTLSPDEIAMRLIHSKCKGIISMAGFNKEILASVKRLELPVVLIDSSDYVGYNLYSQVRATNYASGFDAAAYLINKGHRRLAFAGDLRFASYAQRADGFRAACEEKGVYFMRRNIEGEDARQILKMLSGKDRPTAVFAPNDYLASIVCDACAKFNLSIPRDISVIGFDNIQDPLLKYRLTTFDLPKKAMGEAAVKQLLKEISDTSTPKECVELACTFIERDTAGPAPDC